MTRRIVGWGLARSATIAARVVLEQVGAMPRRDLIALGGGGVLLVVVVLVPPQTATTYYSLPVGRKPVMANEREMTAVGVREPIARSQYRLFGSRMGDWIPPQDPQEKETPTEIVYQNGWRIVFRTDY